MNITVKAGKSGKKKSIFWPVQFTSRTKLILTTINGREIGPKIKSTFGPVQFTSITKLIQL